MSSTAIRPAETADSARISEIATSSLESSYALSPQQIETVVEAAFSEDALADRIEGDERRLFVAEATIADETAVNGVVDVAVGDATAIHWLHVDPEARGEGLGTSLLEHVDSEVVPDGETLIAIVLEDAVEGREFCDQFGLSETETDWADYGGVDLPVTVLSSDAGAEDASPREAAIDVPETATVADSEYAVDDADPIPGRDGPLFRLVGEHTDAAADDAAAADADPADPGGDANAATRSAEGYLCGVCGSTAVTADGLERLECGECGNRHRAEEWDAAHL